MCCAGMSCIFKFIMECPQVRNTPTLRRRLFNVQIACSGALPLKYVNKGLLLEVIVIGIKHVRVWRYQ